MGKQCQDWPRFSGIWSMGQNKQNDGCVKLQSKRFPFCEGTSLKGLRFPLCCYYCHLAFCFIPFMSPPSRSVVANQWA
ncbi:hypothetical protein E2320_007980, partial [Naja naja]